MASIPDLSQDYFSLFGLPVEFAIDRELLGDRFRRLQGELHPDRYATASSYEQRLAVQHSALVNQAYETLRKPLGRALYLMELDGISQADMSRHQIDGGFLIMQMELREKLESIPELMEPDEAIAHLLDEIGQDLRAEQKAFEQAYNTNKQEQAISACVKMQYLDKLLSEAEQLEAKLIDE